MVLAEFDRLVSLTHVVIEGTDVQLVTSVFVTHNPLVLVGMVQPLDSRVALATFYSFRTQVPSYTVNESFAIFWRVLENIRRSSEISSMVREVAALRVMRVFLGRTPTGLVEEHEEA